MAKDSSSRQLRQRIAQHAARMIAEDGVGDFAAAKRKAARQLGAKELECLPTNSEIETELKLYHEIFHADDQALHIADLQRNALAAMQIFACFHPHLTGAVLDGTAGLHAETDIHLFADSLKEVELFLLNQQIPYEMSEKAYRYSRDGKRERRRVPTFTLEGPSGMMRLSVFEGDDLRAPPKNIVDGGSLIRASIEDLKQLLSKARY